MSVLSQIQQIVGTDRKVVELTGLGEGGESILLYSTPVSMGDIDKAKRKNSDMSSGEFMVEVIIAKCETESGDKAFTLADKPGLLRLPVDVILGMFNQVFTSTSVEEHEKN